MKVCPLLIIAIVTESRDQVFGANNQDQNPDIRTKQIVPWQYLTFVLNLGIGESNSSS